MGLSRRAWGARFGRLAASWAVLLVLASCGGGGGDAGAPLEPPAEPDADTGPAWPTFGRSAQHDAKAEVAAQPLDRVVWHTAVDRLPQYRADTLFIHYGSPVITRRNTVIMPVKTGATADFSVTALRGRDGKLAWTVASDYRLPLPAPSWTPSFNLTLLSDGRLAYPLAGGRIAVRETPDFATGATSRVAFYGSACDADPASCDANVFINTPLTPDGVGGLYFGFTVGGANAAGLSGGGIAHVDAAGQGRYTLVASAAADATLTKPQTNSAPALSADGGTLYVVVNHVPQPGQRARGMLLALDTSDLSTVASVDLLDPAIDQPAWVSDNGSSSPTIGPDGDVYIGVLESATAPHNFRGWLLHFDAALSMSKPPAAFGWDITASVVPAGMVPQHTTTSPYLLAIKYNNYGGAGTGDGLNRIAIVDPGQTQADPVHGVVTVMKEAITLLGPTPDPDWQPGGVKEWCVNTMAVDPASSSMLVSSEDGNMYRWYLPGNALAQTLNLNTGRGQAYTPTAVGPDGRVYAVSNAVLYSIGR